MRKETQVGLLALAIFGTVVGCIALFLVLLPKSATPEPRTTGEDETVVVQEPTVAQSPSGNESPRIDSESPELTARADSAEEEIPPRPPLAEPARGGGKTNRVEKEDQSKAPLPEFDSFTSVQREGRLAKAKGQTSRETEPIEIIRAYLTEQLSPEESLKIQIYSDPILATFKRKRAVVLRVVYDIKDPMQTTTEDQLFLVQDWEVKDAVDFVTWRAKLERDLAIRAARIRAAQRAIAAMLAQQRAAQQALANQLSRRPGNC
jgi:hypothetical protein